MTRTLDLLICNGELVGGTVSEQSHVIIGNLLAIPAEAGYGREHVVRCGVWLDDARDFTASNQVFQHYFGEHPPARACVETRMVIEQSGSGLHRLAKAADYASVACCTSMAAPIHP